MKHIVLLLVTVATLPFTAIHTSPNNATHQEASNNTLKDTLQALNNLEHRLIGVKAITGVTTAIAARALYRNIKPLLKYNARAVAWSALSLTTITACGLTYGAAASIAQDCKEAKAHLEKAQHSSTSKQ